MAPVDTSTELTSRVAAERAPSVAPTSKAERLTALDGLRGFALLGILLMNVEYFARPLQGILLGADPSLAGIDRYAAVVVYVLVQGKFWVLFSLLFGMGFAILDERAQRAGRDFAAIWTRRLLVLFFIGLAHATLVWVGDILLPYALAGAGLILMFRATPAERLWKWGIVLYLVPIGLSWFFTLPVVAMQSIPGASELLVEALEAAGAEVQFDYALAETTYRYGSYGETVIQRLMDARLQLQLYIGLIPALIGVFALGTWLVRRGVVQSPQSHRALLGRMLLVCGPVGLLLALLAGPKLMFEPQIVPSIALAWNGSLVQIANLLLALSYFAGFLLLATGPMPWIATALAPAGRMALTNYLLQSLVFTTAFYGYGFGLWGAFSRLELLGLAGGFFLLQLALSHVWLARFRFGPAEWVWRSLTYLERQPLRR